MTMGLYFTRAYHDHLRLVEPQAAQADDYGYLMRPVIRTVVDTTFGLSAWDGARCLGAAGVVAVGDGEGDCWALLSRYASPHMLAITRHVRFACAALPFRRLTLSVREDHAAGHRWAVMIGFRPVEGSSTLYERVAQ